MRGQRGWQSGLEEAGWLEGRAYKAEVGAPFMVVCLPFTEV